MIKQTWVALLLVLATCTWAHTQSRSDSIRMLSSYPQAPTPLDTFVVGWQVVHNFPKLSDSTRLTATAQSNYRSYYLSIDSLNNIYPIKDILNKPLTSESRFTPKEILSIAYKVMDEDPILFKQWGLQYLIENPHNQSYLPNEWIVNNLISQENKTAKIITGTDYIFHIKVIDTAIHGYYKPSGKYYYSTVRAEVMDTIKGRHYLNCIDHPSDKMLPKIASIPATKNCIEFEYSPSLVRLPPAITTLGHLSVREEPLMDTDGTPWVKPGKEYIVFLKLDYLYDESFVVEPDLYSTHMCGMFPINNGIVDNRYGDFGLQANLTTREFIDALKEEIVDIVSP